MGNKERLKGILERLAAAAERERFEPTAKPTLPFLPVLWHRQSSTH